MSCASTIDISGLTTIWAMIMKEIPFLLVLSSWMSLTPGTEDAVEMISFSMSSGRAVSRSSARLGRDIFMATMMIAMLMQHETIGSRIVHLSPRMMAPPIPMRAPMDESASLL